MSGIPVNKGVLRALLQCDMLLHILFMYICEAMLRYFWIKMAKIVSESAFSVIKSLKYCRFCEKIADSLVSFGILLYLCHRLQIVVDHSAGRTSDAQLYQPGIFMPRNQQDDVKGHRPERALLTSGPNDNDGCHSED